MNSAMYYISIVAPEAINEQVAQWKNFMRDRFGCIVALKSPAHITLASPFWMNASLQGLLEDTIKEFSNNQKNFLIELKDFGSFKPRVIFVRVTESVDSTHLRDSLEEHLLTNPLFPIKKTARPFHPHITVANRDLHKTDFYTAWEYFKNKKYEASFMANGITLMKHNGILWEAVYKASFPVM